MAGEFKHQDLIGGGISDDPGVAGITPSKWDKPLRLSGGADKQIVIRKTAADGTTGMDLTDTPDVKAIVFPLTVLGGTPANGSLWAEEVAGVVTLYIKKTDGTLVSLVFG